MHAESNGHVLIRYLSSGGREKIKDATIRVISIVDARAWDQERPWTASAKT